MFCMPSNRRLRRRAAWVAAIAAVVATCTASLHAQSLKETTSLKFVPQNAAFYAVSLRTGELVQSLRNSKAFARIRSNPFVIMGLEQLKTQWERSDDDVVAALRSFYEVPENQQLLQLLLDGLSNEFFVYGDAGLAEQLAMLNRINSINQAAQLEALSRGEDPAELMGKRLLEFLVENVDRLKQAPLVLGMRVSNVDAAAAQIARIEPLLNQAFEQYPVRERIPELKTRLNRQKLGEHEFVTLDLDGTLIPWELAQNDENLQLAPEDFEKLRGAIGKLKLRLAIGLRDDYLIFFCGDSFDELSRMGRDGSLFDREEFAPLRKFADRPITSINYASGEFLQRAGSPEQQLNDLVRNINQMLSLAGVGEDDRQAITKDARELVADISRNLPKQGALLRFAFRTGEGFESYAYSWTENPLLDASRPLTILNHVGGDPLCFSASRTVYAPESYAMLAKWISRIQGHVERIGLPQLPDEEREAYDKVKQVLVPICSHLDEVNRTMLLPAFRDGQTAVVFDAKLSSRRLHPLMPEAKVDLPVPEFAMVCSLSERALLEKAASEYFTSLQKALDGLREVSTDDIPEVRLPEPSTDQTPNGMLYFYDLPPQAQVDSQIKPNAGVSDEILVLSPALATTRRLLSPTPLQAFGPLAGAADRPLGGVGYLNWPAVVEMVKPWIEYGIDLQQERSGASDEAGVAALKDQVASGLEILQCYRGSASVTYREGDAIVTHAMSRFRDLE